MNMSNINLWSLFWSDLFGLFEIQMFWRRKKSSLLVKELFRSFKVSGLQELPQASIYVTFFLLILTFSLFFVLIQTIKSNPSSEAVNIEESFNVHHWTEAVLNKAPFLVWLFNIPTVREQNCCLSSEPASTCFTNHRLGPILNSKLQSHEHVWYLVACDGRLEGADTTERPSACHQASLAPFQTLRKAA